ncbi:MAG: CoA-binding protein [Methanomicrobia archaeon]|nr:CoA-binding protein [Methanomicrobia archaeon]RLF94061.1 MAG: CoA-binding protein [Thermococci archaeon]RLF95327.1 MAG: CoA-binding protein [Thermococci archaeon]
MCMEDFLNKKNKIAVIGVSNNHEKWGYKVYKTLKSSGFDVYAVNPKYTKIDSDRCFPDLRSIPEKLDEVITIVPPKVTENIVRLCKELGIKKVWMQPGSESEDAVRYCKENGIDVMYNACFVVDGLEETI